MLRLIRSYQPNSFCKNINLSAICKQLYSIFFERDMIQVVKTRSMTNISIKLVSNVIFDGFPTISLMKNFFFIKFIQASHRKLTISITVFLLKRKKKRNENNIDQN